MRFDANGARAKNYEPSSFAGPAQTGEPLYAGLEAHSVSGSYAAETHAEDDDFSQAGALYRLMREAERERLVANISGSLAQVAHEDIRARAIEHYRSADPEYGTRVEVAVKQARR